MCIRDRPYTCAFTEIKYSRPSVPTNTDPSIAIMPTSIETLVRILLSGDRRRSLSIIFSTSYPPSIHFKNRITGICNIRIVRNQQQHNSIFFYDAVQQFHNLRSRLFIQRSRRPVSYTHLEARLYINISTYVTTGNREGFEHWAKLNNLKEAARTFNYLSENNLLNYEDFRQHVSDVDASVKAADQRIAHITSELSTQKVIQKHCDSYRLCRKVIEDCKSAKNPKEYRSKHLAEYQLHDSLKKELQDLGVTKIPSSEKIQKRIENLESEQAARCV